MVDHPETKSAEMPLGRIPFMQRILDNPFILLFIGVVVPTVVYILWGVMEITQIPLVALGDVPEGSLFSRLYDDLRLMLK